MFIVVHNTGIGYDLKCDEDVVDVLEHFIFLVKLMNLEVHTVKHVGDDQIMCCNFYNQRNCES